MSSHAQHAVRLHFAHVLLLTVCTAVIGACGSDTSLPPDDSTPLNATPVLVTALNEQGYSAPSNGTVALLPMLQYVTEPTAGSTIVVRFIASSGLAVGDPINLGSNAGDVPVAAFDGTNFLVVYQLTTTGGTNLYGQFFTPAGLSAGAAFPITSTNDTPAVWSVTYGAGTYLVTYHRVIGDFVNGAARFVSPSGAVGSEIIFSDRGGLSASAFDGTRFLIAYAHMRTQVLGRFLHPNGTLEAPFTIDATPESSNGGLQVAFTGTNYVLAYTDSALEGWQARSQAVTPTGTLVGPQFLLVVGPGDDIPRAALSESGSILFTIVTRQPSGWRSLSVRVNSEGTVAPSTQLFSASDGNISAAVTSMLDGKYLAVINRKTATWDVFARLSPAP